MKKKILFVFLLILSLTLIIGCSSKQITSNAVNPVVIRKQGIQEGNDDEIICTCGCNRPAEECGCEEAQELLEENKAEVV